MIRHLAMPTAYSAAAVSDGAGMIPLQFWLATVIQLTDRQSTG
jgi:hypothetical protein